MLHAYIDWNNNGEFDTTGVEYRTETFMIGAPGEGEIKTFSFIVPDDVVKDEWLHMRVLLHYKSGDEGETDPCDKFETGQYQEYLVKVVGNGTGLETNFHSDLTVYPNPTDGIINIVGNTEVFSYAIYSIDNKLMKIGTNPNGIIDITSYPKGMYLLKLQTEEGELTHKVILK